jgi:hypothetical protein
MTGYVQFVVVGRMLAWPRRPQQLRTLCRGQREQARAAGGACKKLMKWKCCSGLSKAIDMVVKFTAGTIYQARPQGCSVHLVVLLRSPQPSQICRPRAD